MNTRKTILLVGCLALLLPLAGPVSAGDGRDAVTAQQSSDTGAATTETTELLVAKGKVKINSKKAKTIAIEVKKKGFMVFVVDENTAFEHADSIKDIKIAESVTVKYEPVGEENVTRFIMKNLVALPAGVKLVKTDELAALLEQKLPADRFVLIDSRPAKKYKLEHIPGAISVPFSELQKEGGAKLLPTDKDLQLVFYCGGNT